MENHRISWKSEFFMDNAQFQGKRHSVKSLIKFVPIHDIWHDIRCNRNCFYIRLETVNYWETWPNLKKLWPNWAVKEI